MGSNAVWLNRLFMVHSIPSGSSRIVSRTPPPPIRQKNDPKTDEPISVKSYIREFYESVDLFNFLWDRTVLAATFHDDPYALLRSSLANLAQYLWDRKMFQSEVQYSVPCDISYVAGCSICRNLLYKEYPVSFTFVFRKWSLPKI
jgi:hypothetical protein